MVVQLVEGIDLDGQVRFGSVRGDGCSRLPDQGYLYHGGRRAGLTAVGAASWKPFRHRGWRRGVFTRPWSATVTYGRPLGQWLENVCAENPHKYGAEKDAQVPTADKPDF